VSRLEQDIQAFTIDREARGLSPRTIEFYAHALRYRLAWQESQGVSDMQLATPALVRHPTGRRNSGRCAPQHSGWVVERYVLQPGGHECDQQERGHEICHGLRE